MPDILGVNGCQGGGIKDTSDIHIKCYKLTVRTFFKVVQKIGADY